MRTGASAAVTRSISIIVEWENANRIGSGRALRILQALGHQLLALPTNSDEVEILFMHGASMNEPEAVAETVNAAGVGVPWRSVGLPGSSYAEQKQQGAVLARGDILVFLDSDVIPQPGWLEGLISAFSESQTKIVCGNTFVDYFDFYSAAMALGWLFPLRQHATGLVEVTAFQANNFAIRREIFESLPALDCQGLRDGTMKMVEMLRQRGHRILLNRAAVVAHPPPEGARAFVIRALWSGLDNALRWKRRRSRWRGAIALLGDLIQVWLRVARQYRLVGFGIMRAISAACQLSVYYSLRLVGYGAGLAAPNFTGQRLAAADLQE